MGSQHSKEGDAEPGADPAEGALSGGAFDRVADQLPLPLWVFDHEHRVVYCNAETARFGIGDDTGVSLEKFSEGYQTVVGPLLAECLRTGEPQTSEEWVLSDVRGRGYWHVHCMPLPGELVGCVIVDWTVRKHAEQLASQSEERYRQLVAGMAEGVAINDRNGGFLFANPACERLFGVGPGQLTGRNAEEFIPAEETAAFDVARARRRLGETSAYELRIRAADGRLRHVWVTSSPRFDEAGGFDGSHALFLDLEQLKRTERALKERTEQFSILIETMAEGVMMTDEDWCLTFVNPAAARLLGGDAADLTGRNLSEFVGEESSFALSEWSDVADRASGVNEEVRLQALNGSEPVVRVWIGPQYVDGKLGGRFVVAQEITETKRAELIQQLLLRISEAVGTSSSVEELITFIHGEINGLIPAPNLFVALYDEEAHLYRFPYFVDEKDRDFGPQAMANSITDYVRRTGEPLLADENWVIQRIAEGVIGPYGPQAPIWLGVPLKTRRGTIGVVAIQDYKKEYPYSRQDLDLLSYASGYIAMAIDRKRAEEVLRHSEIRFRLLIDGMLEGMSTTDAAGIVEFANPALEQIFGVEPGGLTGEHITDFLSPAQQVVEQEQHELRLRGESSSYELQITRPDGETRDLLLSAAPRFGPRGQVIGTSAMVQDITQRKQAEAERERIWNQMLHAQKMESLGRLASGISHDFNNILLAVLGNAELSRMELPQDSPVQRNLAEVVSAVKRGKSLVQQVLALGRRTEPRQVTVEVHSIVREVIGLMRAGVPGNIEVRHESTASSDVILADPAQVHQVLMNLCTNAVQAMEDEGGTLDVRVGEVNLGFRALDDAPELAPGKYVTVTVSDTGPGMSAEIREQIFEPFYTTKQAGIGTGLGLAVVQGIVTNYDGMVSVESELGKGAAFTAYFPAAQERQVMQNDRRENATPAGVRVLFVDDDDAPLRVGTRMLERLGFEVVATASAEDALEQFRADPAAFGALVTDLTMPGMSGLELAAAVKSMRPDLAVVLCTGLDAAPDVEHAVNSGVCKCLTKPYGLKDLEEMLATILAGDESDPEL